MKMLQNEVNWFSTNTSYAEHQNLQLLKSTPPFRPQQLLWCDSCSWDNWPWILLEKTKQRSSKPSNILFYLSFSVGSKDVSNFVLHSFIIIRLVVNKSVNIVEQNVWCFITVYNCHNQKCNIRPLISSKILVEQPMNELPLLCVLGFGFIHRYVDKQRKFVNLFYLAGIQMGTIGRKWETE